MPALRKLRAMTLGPGKVIQIGEIELRLAKNRRGELLAEVWATYDAPVTVATDRKITLDCKGKRQPK